MSEEIIFEGKVMYANIPPRTAQKAFEGEDLSYSVLVECTEARFKELKKAGIPALTQLKEFDGVTYLKLKASKVKNCADGRKLEFKDIPVVSEDGTQISDSLANGSSVRALASLDDIKGRAGKKVLRLKAVVVTDLIPYGNSEGGALAKLGVKAVAKPAAPTVASDDLGDIF